MPASRVSFEGAGRPVDGFLALPEGRGPPRPAVIVIHEIWGLIPHIESVAERLAREGYIALAPDLYTGELKEAMSPQNIMSGMMFLRQAPPEVQRDPAKIGELIARRTPEEQRALRTLMRVTSPEQRQAFGHDLFGAARYLRSREDVDPERVGSVGFCMGGSLSALLAVLDPMLRACIVFYGENPPLARVPAIRAPLLGLYGATDRRITDGVPELADAMRRAHKSFEYHVYPGAGHAFFNDTRKETYQPEAATDAWRRVLEFFGRELGPARPAAPED